MARLVDLPSLRIVDAADPTKGANWVDEKALWSGAVARTVNDKLIDVCSVRDFGARVDGVTNDAAACQLAAQSSANPTIRVPAGTMVLTTSPAAGGSSPLWIMEKGAATSGAGVLPGQVVYEEPGRATQRTGYSLSSFTNDAGIQVRCGEGAAGDINFSYAIRSGGNGIWLWPTGGSATPMEFHSIDGATGVKVINVSDCSIDLVPHQALVGGTKYYIYAHCIGGALDFNFSATSVPVFGNPFGFTPITGWACAGGDPRQRLVGMVQLTPGGLLLASAAGPGFGVSNYNLSSYYNRQRCTNHNYPAGAVAFATTALWGGLATATISACMFADGYEPFVMATGTLSNDTAGTTTFVGISINGADPITYQKIGHHDANYSMAFSVTAPAGSPNYVEGRNTWALKIKVTGGTTSLDTGCVITASVEN